MKISERLADGPAPENRLYGPLSSAAWPPMPAIAVDECRLHGQAGGIIYHTPATQSAAGLAPGARFCYDTFIKKGGDADGETTLSLG